MFTAKYITMSFLLVSLFLTAGCDKTTSNPVKETTALVKQFTVAGSGSNLPVTQELAKAYNDKTGNQVIIPESIGSAGAINAVKAGELELGLISRPLTSEERAQGLKELPYARVAVVFASHRNVADSYVSSEEVTQILAGSKNKWSDQQKIIVFTRQDNDSTNQVLYSLIPQYKEELAEANNAHRWQTLYRNSDMLAALISTEGSFGLTTLPEIVQADAVIKPLLLDGIAPSRENILNGSYKPVIPLSFVYKEKLSSRAAAFINFVFSEEGRQVMERMNALPVGR